MWSPKSSQEVQAGAGRGSAVESKRAGRKRPKRLGLFAGLIAGLLLAAAWLLLSEPEFYRAAYDQGAAGGHQSARKFVAQMANIYNGVQNRGRWDATLSQKSVNAWLATDGADQVRAALPEWLSEPRVAFEPDHVLLGLRCRLGPLRTVLSVRARLWVPRPETVAVQIESVKLGRIRLPKRTVVAWSRQAARAAKLRIEWRSYEGDPVAIVQPARPERPKLALTDLRLTNGALRLLGAVPARFRSGQPLPPALPLPDSAGRNAAVHDPPAARLR